MSSGYRAMVPGVVAEYFGLGPLAEPEDHPVIVQAYRQDLGWKYYPMRKRISRSWARKMRADGYESVTLECHGRTADFQIAEILR